MWARLSLEDVVFLMIARGGVEINVRMNGIQKEKGTTDIWVDWPVKETDGC